ncbi:MAG TPA: hypothetical protein VEY12_10810 [Thermoplasmata archaeon]|nr:hypothetical protein [Thermoplasmata archaeon]
MKPENGALLVIVVAVVVVAVVIALGIGEPRPTRLPTTLPIPAGTVIDPFGYNVSFAVVGGIGRVVGAWYANRGGAFVIDPSDVPLPTFSHGSPCGNPMVPWNGTLNVSLRPGTYAMGFWPMAQGGTFVVTKTILLGYPGDSLSATNTTYLTSCRVPP